MLVMNEEEEKSLIMALTAIVIILGVWVIVQTFPQIYKNKENQITRKVQD